MNLSIHTAPDVRPGQPGSKRNILTMGGVDTIVSPVMLRALRLEIADSGHPLDGIRHVEGARLSGGRLKLQVAGYVKQGRIQEVADYCETDVVNTYRVWLRYELFRGGLSSAEFEASEAALRDFVRAKATEKPHLVHYI